MGVGDRGQGDKKMVAGRREEVENERQRQVLAPLLTGYKTLSEGLNSEHQLLIRFKMGIIVMPT